MITLRGFYYIIIFTFVFLWSGSQLLVVGNSQNTENTICRAEIVPLRKFWGHEI
jgi:hypothetical protein